MFNDTDIYFVSPDYFSQPHIQRFINDVENFVDMSNIDSYGDLEKRLKRFFRKKGSNEPYKHQVDVFAQFYNIKPTAITRPKTKGEVRQVFKDDVPQLARIYSRKEQRTYLEPIVYMDIVMKYKGETKSYINREVVLERHIPDNMVKCGYQYRVRDRETGRIVKWMK